MDAYMKCLSMKVIKFQTVSYCPPVRYVNKGSIVTMLYLINQVTYLSHTALKISPALFYDILRLLCPDWALNCMSTQL